MESRKKSLWIIFFLYLIAFGLGLGIYFLVYQIYPHVLIASLIANVAMTLLIWFVGLMLKNASTYDPYWSVYPPLQILFWFLIFNQELTLMRLLLLLAFWFWGIRLTWNWMINFKNLKNQDWRYTMIQSRNPKLWFLANLFGINLMPTLIVFIQLISVYYWIQSEEVLNQVSIFGFMGMIVATLLQIISDKQMRNFRNAHQSNKLCMRQGLWKYSRHPNYFGEVLFWWSTYLFVFGTTKEITLTILPPVLMTLLFMFISIPMMERKILITRPEYKQIQSEISILIPFFPRKKRIEENN